MASSAPNPSIDTCAACGKLFPRLQARLCLHCLQGQANRFELVRQYLAGNQGATIPEIALGTGLTRGDVVGFMAEGRLVSRAAGQSRCTCAGDGQRCAHCKRDLARKMNEVDQERRPSAAPAAEELPPVRYVRRTRRTD